MKRNNIRILFLTVGWMGALSMFAQDPLPAARPIEKRTEVDCPAPQGTLKVLSTIEVNHSMPKSFLQTQPDTIIREEKLFPIFEKLTDGRAPVRIIHLGDSHIRGHVLTVATRRTLEEVFGSQAVYSDPIDYHTTAKARETGEAGLVYHAIGINGATTLQFSNEERIQEVKDLNPDLIILSFGTNESHSKRYSVSEHKEQMDALLTLLHRACPKAVVMMTTPPGSYLRINRNRRVINQRTPQVVETLLQFAQERELPIWDLYDIAGGKNKACLNWKSGRFMQRDQVHYTHEGYRLQGNLLAEALLNAYNHYVEY